MMNSLLRCALTFSLLAMIGICSDTLAAEFVINGDFETDAEEFVVWPGYVGGTNDAGDANPDEVAEWSGSGGRGINPVFAPSNPAEIEAWPGFGGRGINPILDGSSPFRDNGDNETIVAFMQGATTIGQEVSGLSVGTSYTLSWEYNSRDCCGDFPTGGLALNGDMIDVAEFTEEILPVGGFEPWYAAETSFTADATDLLIEFSSVASFGGDATMLLDNISLVADGGGANLVTNGDFEANPDDFDIWPGYTGGGGGNNAPFRDTGDNDTSVAFMQGAASLGQIVEGLVVGQEYSLSLDFNARNCCGNELPIAELLLDGALVEDFPGDDFEDGIVDPVGGQNPWYNYSTTFTAQATSLEILVNTFPAGVGGGDSTLTIDNVSVADLVPSVPGDFNGDGLLTAIDVDLLSEEVRAGTNLAEFDLNNDALVNDVDHGIWVTDLKNTYFGDANLDLEFNSSDLVQVFQRGKYEDDQPLNATWEDGDWNADGEFSSSDLVKAFQDGGYNIGPRPAASAVPEPSTGWLLLVGVVWLLRRRR